MKKMSTFCNAFRLSLPVLGAYWFLGITYGLLASEMGYPFWVPATMALVIYSGSVEFIALTLLMGRFNPTADFIIAVMVGARHMFYGIAMLESYRNAGWKKPLLIFWLSDETFAINFTIREGPHSQHLWVSLLDCLYWLSGSIMGYLLGNSFGDVVNDYLRGLDFVVTAMFVTIFMDDFMRNRQSHGSAWLGIGASLVCLFIFGNDQFIVPAMACILVALYFYYYNKVVHAI